MSSSLASEQFGRFTATLANSQEYLTIHFSPSASARQERWRNYGLSADFLGDYFANFFPGGQLPDSPMSQRKAIKSAVSFVANELLENAIKYSDDSVEEPIVLSIYLYRDQIIIRTVNYVAQTTATSFKAFIQRLLAAESADTLFAEQLELAALNSGQSGMGIATMVCDYGIELGWEFQPLAIAPETIRVDSLAHLDLQSFKNELSAS